MEQHTPGPWKIAESIGNNLTASKMRRVRCVNEGMEHGAVCEVYGASDGSIASANARLIAAAPELLAAVEAMCATFRTFRNVPLEEQEWTALDDEALEAGFNAIAKAKGE
jgi:hypothetical protein